MIDSFKNKRILFIGQVFYDYHSKIADQLRTLGAHVTFFENKIFRHDSKITKTYLLSFGIRTLTASKKKKHQREILNSISNQQFDILFCIGGFSITKKFVSQIRNLNPSIKCIIYFWDSFNIYNYSDSLESFDKCYSFDRLDVQKYSKLNYLPLFYTDEFTSNDSTAPQDIDLLYIGSVGQISINRCVILGQIERQAQKQNYKYFLWLLYPPPKRNLTSKVIHKIRVLISPTYKKYIQLVNDSLQNFTFLKEKPLTRLETAELLKRAKCVIDIPIPNQEGLTIRTIETLAMGKKIITTNKSILKEPFFSKNSIKVISEDNFQLERSFIESQPSEKIDLSPLYVKNWLISIIQP